ncbi:phage tail protein [Jiangella sp. DSM 45060]|uniref:phage tail protein n=1 Tax=Jiangella sp. DSM 45060 TaxID=1798224 RepID=UPI00087DA3F6|nr:phage tail protein [Jiangella sp. DSM 45060]SDS70894.1 phage tail protein domain-containing protein [Jiangella sp. DSM 45060]
MRPPQWLVTQMPIGMLDDDFFVRFLSIFQHGADSLAEGADNLEHLGDVSVAPDAMVRWLAGWIGLDGLDPSLPGRAARTVVRASAETLAWRGTVHGLTRTLEVLSGGPAEVLDGGGVWLEGEAPPDPAWVRMTVATTGWLSEPDFAAVVADEVPAHVRAQLWVEDRLIWTSAADGGGHVPGAH